MIEEYLHLISNNIGMFCVIVVSWGVSILCLIRLYKKLSFLEKIMALIISILPIIGPILIYAIWSDMPSSGSRLSNRSYRGDYTKNWETVKSWLDEKKDSEEDKK